MRNIPSNVAKLMAPADRANLGKAAWTPQECAEKATGEAEKKLQADIRQYLHLHSIIFINPDMRKKSPLPVGWPDFTFAYNGVPVGVECKVAGKQPKDWQSETHARMMKDGWRILIAYSVVDVQNLMREIDATAREAGR